MICIN